MLKNELLNLLNQLSDKTITLIVYGVVFNLERPEIRKMRKLGAGANVGHHFTKAKQIIEKLEKHDETIAALQELLCSDFKDRLTGKKDRKPDIL